MLFVRLEKHAYKMPSALVAHVIGQRIPAVTDHADRTRELTQFFFNAFIVIGDDHTRFRLQMFKQFDAVQHFSRLHVVGVRHDPRRGFNVLDETCPKLFLVTHRFRHSVNTDLNAVVFL